MDPRPPDQRPPDQRSQDQRPPNPNTGPQRTKGTPSELSQSSSARSDISAILLKQKAKTEAARVRLQYANKEAKMLISQAEQEAALRKLQTESKINLKILESECELEETEALLRVFSEGFE